MTLKEAFLMLFSLVVAKNAWVAKVWEEKGEGDW